MRKLYLLFATLLSLSLSAEVYKYTPDNETVFPNPERGFTEELGGEHYLSDSKPNVVKTEESWYWDEEDQNYEDRKNQSLVVLMYYLRNYIETDLSEKMLNGFDEDMQILRNHGFKCVLRFAYDWKSKNDAEPEWVQRHIAQLKPYWKKNADVIYVLEAGFIGRWGEWYYTKKFDDKTQHLTDKRRAVLNTLLAACPEDRFLLVRYPMIKAEYFGDENPLTETEAFTETSRARLGHHNDAFLNEWGNDGTYVGWDEEPDDDPEVRKYIADETRYVPNGGETNVEEDDSPGLAEQVYRQAEDEMSRYHWSFCGSTYSEDVTRRWRTSGIFETLNKRLGYRFQLIEANFPEEATIGTNMPLSITMRNTGFAPLYNKRTVYLVFRSDAHTFSIPLPADLRRVLPGSDYALTARSLNIPDDLVPGTYHLYLHMPDAYESLANDPRYAIRLANKEVWDAATGMNDLGATVELVNNMEGFENVEQIPAPTKILREGQLFIHRGDKAYTITGQNVTLPSLR